MKRLHKGIWYWSTFQEARAYAHSHGHTRIIKYGRGWAVQVRISGPYAGTLSDYRKELSKWSHLDGKAETKAQRKAVYRKYLHSRDVLVWDVYRH
jgi:hypothetical protein